MTGHPQYQRVLSNGIFFTGGGSVANCFREQLLPEFEITRTLSKTPFLDNINGLKIAMANKEKYKNYFMF